jgi:hypothetical protein
LPSVISMIPVPRTATVVKRRFLAIVATLDGFGGCDGTAGAGRVAAGGEA